MKMAYPIYELDKENADFDETVEIYKAASKEVDMSPALAFIDL